MKQTTFRFELRATREGGGDAIQVVRERLAALPGVALVNCDQGGDTCVLLQVVVEFADAEKAKSLHRQIMLSLMKTEGVRIAEASTTLTDVF